AVPCAPTAWLTSSLVGSLGPKTLTFSIAARLWRRLGQRAFGVRDEERARELGADVRVGLARAPRLTLDARAVASRGLVRHVDGSAPDSTAARADRQDDRPLAVARRDDVLGPARAVEEVPRPQLPLLALDDQRAAAFEHNEAFLR